MAEGTLRYCQVSLCGEYSHVNHLPLVHSAINIVENSSGLFLPFSCLVTIIECCCPSNCQRESVCWNFIGQYYKAAIFGS